MNNSYFVGKRIRSYRKSIGMSIKGLHKRTGISETFLRNIEAGSRPISIDVFIKISKALQVHLNYLLRDISKQADIFFLDNTMRESNFKFTPTEFATMIKIYQLILKECTNK